MGLDINARSGVVITEKQMAAIIHDENCSRACQILLRYVAYLFKQLKDNMDSGALEETDVNILRQKAGLLTKRLAELTLQSSVTDVREMLLSVTKGIADGYDSYVKNSEIALELWKVLIERLYPNAPIPESTLFIDAPRYQGWGLPGGEVLYCFSEDECFERVKTSQGIALDEMIGESTKPASWTVYSI